MSILTYQYRIKDGRQGSAVRKAILAMAGGVNLVWNYTNELSCRSWKQSRKVVSAYALNVLVAGCSKELGLHSQTLQAVCEEHAIRRAQAKRSKLAWRSRKRSLPWIPFKASGIRLDGDSFRYAGKRFRFWRSRGLPEGAVVKGGCIVMDARGRAYLNLQVEVADPEPSGEGIPLGLDFGLKTQIARSDGVKHDRENLTRAYEQRLAKAQRAGHKRQVRNLHARIRNARRDWTHKTTTGIVRAASLVAVGNVSSKKLARTRMAKSVYDSGWGRARAFLGYKAIRLGKVAVDVNENGTTVTCSACLQKTGPSGLGGLGVREWTCGSCGTTHDRDVNSGRNILRLGLAIPPQTVSPSGHGGPSRHRPRRKAAGDAEKGITVSSGR